MFKRHHSFAHFIALFAIIFASVMPTISHAFATPHTTNFYQEICTTQAGKQVIKKIAITVTTTLGNQTMLELDVNAPVTSESSQINHHYNHCPFCSAPAFVQNIDDTHAILLQYLSLKTPFSFVDVPAVKPATRYLTTLPSRAPPTFI